MKNIWLNMLIGLRLKLAVSILVSTTIIILGIILYRYQKNIIVEQVKQNSYATINDLIRFTDNEIDSSRDKIEYFGQVAVSYLNALGACSIDTSEKIIYYGYDERIDKQIPIEVPLIKCGNTSLNGNTSIYSDLQKMGIEFFMYYQKTDHYFVEILNSNNQDPLKVNATFAYPRGYLGFWRLSDESEPVVRFSHWIDKWLQTVRLYVRDVNGEIIGAIVVGIQERNEDKLALTFKSKTFYENGLCYTVNGEGIVTNHSTLPAGLWNQDSIISHLISTDIVPEVSYFTMKDSLGIEKYIFYKYHPANFNSVVVEIPEKEIFASLHVLRNGILIAILVVVFFIYLTITYIANAMTGGLSMAIGVLERLALGDTSTKDELVLDRKDEIGNIANAVNGLNKNLNKISEFANVIGQGKLETEFEPLSDADQLGNSLINMQNSLIKAKEDEKFAQAEEEKKQWTSNGLVKFSDILSSSDNNIEVLAYNILKSLIDYVGLTMGAFYVVEEDDDIAVYVPQAAVAYERKKIINAKIRVGEGLVGRCAYEKLPIYMTDIPDQYITIRSGLGDANPGYLLIVPLITNSEVLGVIELASFNAIDDYKMDFIEKLAESIGTTLKSSKVNQQTIKLLEQSKMQSEELAAQEEEMRQNMEELQSTQEEAHRRETEILGVIDSIEKTVFKAEYNFDGTIMNINAKYASFLNENVETMLQKNISFEYEKLGLPINNSEIILSKCSSGQNYTEIIQTEISGKTYLIEENYSPVFSIDEHSPLRVLKISYVMGPN